MEYDLIVPVYWDTEPFLNWNLDYLKNGTKAKRLVLVGPEAIKEKIPDKEYVSFIDGNQIVRGMSKESISELLKNISLESINRSGWYFQQFIKMGYSFLCKDEYYAVMDLDTVPRDISFFEGDKPVFYVSNENHKEYFETMNNVMPGVISKYNNKSFVNQFMVFNKTYMLELIERIDQSNAKGDIWWKKIINSINPIYIAKAGFSEFETYGNYVMQYHHESYEVRQLKQCRSAAAYLSMNPSEEMIDWALESFDALTIENWSANDFWFFWSKALRKKIPLSKIAAVHDFFRLIIIQLEYHINKIIKKTRK